jgi:hypothetical protein
MFLLLKVCMYCKINFAKGAYYNQKNQFVQQSAITIKIKIWTENQQLIPWHFYQSKSNF